MNAAVQKKDADVTLEDHLFQNIPSGFKCKFTTSVTGTAVFMEASIERPDGSLKIHPHDDVFNKDVVEPLTSGEWAIRVTLAFSGNATVDITVQILTNADVPIGLPWSLQFVGKNGDVCRARARLQVN